MAKSNPFKSFITYGIGVGLYAKLLNREDANEKIERRATEDPTGATWGTMGFVSPDGSGDFAIEMAGSGAVMLAVQINERILPGKVRDEHLKERLKAVREMEGRDPGKKEYAQLRDEVEAELLPKSHIRRTTVPVLVYEKRVVFFTSSAKRASDLASLLWSLCNDFGFHPKMLPLATKDTADAWLTSVAKSEDDSPLVPLDSAVIRAAFAEDKSVVRIKDKDIDDSDVQALLADSDYRVTELLVSVLEGAQDGPQGVAGASFTVTDKLIVKNLKFPDLAIREAIGEAGAEDDLGKAEFMGMGVLVALSVTAILDVICVALGGEDRTVYDEGDDTPDLDAFAEADDEDDEL